jgi:hypothetical protein
MVDLDHHCCLRWARPVLRQSQGCDLHGDRLGRDELRGLGGEVEGFGGRRFAESTYAARFSPIKAAFARSITVLDNAANSALAHAVPGITPVQLARASSVTPSTTADVLDSP